MAKKQQRQSERLHLKSEAALHFSEERMQLLETVRQMIDSEFERREHERGYDVNPTNSPPCRSLWQWILDRHKEQRAKNKNV
ncbi:MAG TPA: hypothetical protein PLK45_02870 [Paludibacteraceae bacterium]|jgi:hypothetical protein|nr:hypothetical protein [Paludibacteraceae bacterium]